MSFKIKLSQQNIFFYIVERILRSHPITYLFIRYIIGKYLFSYFHESDLYGLKNFHMNKDLTILDIGANDGVSSKLFKLLFPKSIIYAYEPMDLHFSKINKLSSKNIYLRQFGVSSKENKIYLYYPSISFFNKKYYLSSYTFTSKEELQKDIREHFVFRNKLVLERTLIEIKPIQENFKNRIFLIKIDVNGNEFDIIKSLENHIIKSLPVIISEVSEGTFKINNYLEKFGYKAYAYKKNGNFFYRNYSLNELNLYYLRTNHLNNIKIN